MAGFTVCMTGQRQCSLDRLHRQIHQIPGYEHISKTEIPMGEGMVWLLVYEKYYFRSSYTSLAILLTEQGQEQTAYLVASGGGDGLSNLSYGANRKMAMECVGELEKLGFSADPRRSDKLPGNLLERYFK